MINRDSDRLRAVYVCLVELCRNMKKPDDAHNLSHFERVWRNGLDIAKGQNIDLNVLEPALLLHDLGRVLELPEEAHAVEVRSKASEVLLQAGYSAQEIERIIDVIETHSRSSVSKKSKTLEGKIVYDADKVDGVGKQTIERAKVVGKLRGWTEKQTAIWYLERILDVAKNEPLYTVRGKKMANERIPISLSWCKQVLNKEFYVVLDKWGFESETSVHF